MPTSFEQLSFMNCSVRSFSSSVGWESTPSSLNVALVEDPKNGDSFTRNLPGTPAFFNATAFQFGGIIQSWNENKDSNGNPTFDVVLHDPRDILNGVQLILDSYNGGVFGVPNLYNIYGYLESVSFGYSGRNDNGIEWWKIRDAFLALQATSPIVFTVGQYTVNLSNLPSLPTYYRIDSQNMSLMDFISEICDATSRDFFFRFTSDLVLTLYTVNRSSQPGLSYITNFIENQDEVVASNTGYELRNETTSKFLVGGPVQELYYVWKAFGEPGVSEDNTIWPCWGVDYNGNLVLGTGSYPHNNHGAILDSVAVDVIGVGDTYKMDVREMRAALHSQESWELTLIGYNNEPDSIHYQKATRVGMLADKTIDFLSTIGKDELDALTPKRLFDLTRRSVKDKTEGLLSQYEENINRLYDYVRSFASEFYGRKLIIGISGIQTKRDLFTNEILTNYETSDGGYINDIYFSGAVSVNLLPLSHDFITLEDGRIQAYAKFDDYTTLDFTELGPDDYRMWQDSLFVKATIDPKIFFTNITGATGARAILEFPAPIYIKNEPGKPNYLNAFRSAVEDKLKKRPDMTDAQIETFLNSLFMRFGGEALFDGTVGLAELPDMVAIPLKSNVNTYGPWYVIGANGKTEVEVDTELVPWNYGGYATMNLAANSRVTSALTNMQIGEGGSITIPGLPSVLLGGELIAGGPLVTDVSTDIGEDGVKTTYRLQTWTPRFGKVQKQLVDNLQKIAVNNKKLRTRLTRQQHVGKPGDTRIMERGAGWPERKKPSSSHQLILGEYIAGSSGNLNVVTAPHYNVASHLGSGYEYKVFASLDTLFTPFTTDPNSTTLPHFPLESGVYTISASSLNPYGKNSFGIVSRTHLLEAGMEPSGDYKSLALRVPMIMGGWGYDINDKPVPNFGIESDLFASGYATDPTLWKVGPLDLRWNNDISCWQAANSPIMRGTLLSNLSLSLPNASFSGYDGTMISVTNWLVTGGFIAYSGYRGIAAHLNGDWVLFAVQPPC